MKPHIENLKVGDFVWIKDSDLYGRFLTKAKVIQFLEEDFILLRHEFTYEDSFNIIALAVDDNEVYPDTKEVRDIAKKLRKIYDDTMVIDKELSDIWFDFVREDIEYED